VRMATAIKAWHATKGNVVKVSQAHVWNWLNSDTPAPPSEHCRAIEDIADGVVTRYELRPDVFGETPACECPPSQPRQRRHGCHQTIKVV
jgi:DNA-binding transcriptional regulator YdaS (Cro superfamily)